MWKSTYIMEEIRQLENEYESKSKYYKSELAIFEQRFSSEEETKFLAESTTKAELQAFWEYSKEDNLRHLANAKKSLEDVEAKVEKALNLPRVVISDEYTTFNVVRQGNVVEFQVDHSFPQRTQVLANPWRISVINPDTSLLVDSFPLSDVEGPILQRLFEAESDLSD